VELLQPLQFRVQLDCRLWLDWFRRLFHRFGGFGHELVDAGHLGPGGFQGISVLERFRESFVGLLDAGEGFLPAFFDVGGQDGPAADLRGGPGTPSTRTSVVARSRSMAGMSLVRRSSPPTVAMTPEFLVAVQG
jgi:hypothetical protein